MKMYGFGSVVFGLVLAIGATGCGEDDDGGDFYLEFRERYPEDDNTRCQPSGQQYPMRHRESDEGESHFGKKTQTAHAIRVRRNQVQIDARHLPQKAHPDEQSEIPSEQYKLENRQAHKPIPHAGKREFRAFSRGN